MTATLERRLGVFSATTLIVGSMIGSGIFIAPSIMAGYVAAPGIWLGLWLVGGALTLLGALSYAELCAMMPQAGGQYVFLREAFGRVVAFLYGWTLFLVIQTGFNAAVAIAFAKFLGGVGLHVGENDVVFTLGRFVLSRAQLVAVGVIALLTWINARGVREGALVQNVFTVLKVGAVAALVVVGFASGKGSLSHFTPVLGTALGPRGLELGLFAAMGV
ncbi:MAG TPA: amino acid permease, partial [Polyangiaceae bacterium]